MADRNAEILNEQAAAWFVRLQRSDLSVDDRNEFDQWMQDPAHAVAYLRVDAAWERAARLRAFPLRPGAAARQPRRRIAVTRRMAAGVALALGAGLVGAVTLRGAASFATALGERKVCRLPDGSRIHLNTASRIEVNYLGAERRIRLLAGEALFAVAKDPRRPFVVRADRVSVQALGTVFNVRLRDSSVEVTVTEGVVAVADAPPKGSARNLEPPTNRLAAGQAAMVSPGAVAEIALDPAALEKRVVWTEGVIDLHGETLEQAVLEFNRYSETKLVLGDPALAAVRVGGTFKTEDSEKFVAALQAGFGVSAVRGQNVVYLLPG